MWTYIILFIIVAFLIYKIRKEGFMNNKYMRMPKEANSNNIYDIPTIDYMNEKTIVNIKQILKLDYFKKYFKKYLFKLSDEGYTKKNVIKHVGGKRKNIDIDDDIYVNFQLQKTNNKLLNYFVKEFYKNVENQFVIQSYRLVNYYESDADVRYGMIFVLYEHNGYYGYTIYVRGSLDKNKKVIFDSYEFIGYYYTDQFNLNPGFDKSLINQQLFNQTFQKIKTPDKSNKLFTRLSKYNFGCFNIKNNTLIKAENKFDCENSFKFYGDPKPQGLWDRKCEKNEDCLFYKANTNYDNDFGKCTNGTCQLPLNMEKIGYRYYNPNKKPYCYNCTTKDWKSVTYLGECCDEQKKQGKSPDYAFKGDFKKRTNFERQKERINLITVKDFINGTK
tara:strand:- start:310 stop:1476 length:1167 start_codon:yes stop_codon:yes gene_type:complete